MNEESFRTSSELIRWLKLLALPLWAKVAIASIMLITLADRGAPWLTNAF